MYPEPLENLLLVYDVVAVGIICMKAIKLKRGLYK